MSNQPEQDTIDAAEIEQTNKATDNVETTEQTQQDDSTASLDSDALQTALTTAESKAEENWELYLKARAEADNIRKRAERDVSNAHRYALEKFIPELLTVKDSLELGTKAARENADADNEQLSKFLEGSDMAVNMFNDALTKVGVVTIAPNNETFDPELHQAMTMVPNPDLPANTIIEVIQKGYSLNERLIRPAMVIVSKKD